MLSRNEHTGEQGYKLVTRLFRGHTDRVVYLRIAKASSVQRGRSERRSSGSRKGGSSSDGEEKDPAVWIHNACPTRRDLTKGPHAADTPRPKVVERAFSENKAGPQGQ